MAHHRPSRASRTHDEDELWFAMPSPPPSQPAHIHVPGQSPYRPNQHDATTYPTPSGVPKISTGWDLNKPLPPSPSDSARIKSRPSSLQHLPPLEHARQLETTLLCPQPYPYRYHGSGVDPSSPCYHNYSRSMPSSPCGYHQAPQPSHTTAPHRTQSTTDYYTESTQYDGYSLPFPRESTTAPFDYQRSTSTGDQIFLGINTPSRSHTFPEPGTFSPTARDIVTSKPRPHTWLSPTEPFTDISQFHLFAEAMTGLPPGSGSFSPTGPPELQGSLFARRPGNDRIPIPLQNTNEAQSTRHDVRNDWQNFEPPLCISAHSTSAANILRAEPREQWRPPLSMNAVNAELQILGLGDELEPEDELPDYAQSQAEMDAKKRVEASARARELEARWRCISRR